MKLKNEYYSNHTIYFDKIGGIVKATTKNRDFTSRASTKDEAFNKIKEQIDLERDRNIYSSYYGE